VELLLLLISIIIFSCVIGFFVMAFWFHPEVADTTGATEVVKQNLLENLGKGVGSVASPDKLENADLKTEVKKISSNRFTGQEKVVIVIGVIFLVVKVLIYINRLPED